jgi:hypothetical protein
MRPIPAGMRRCEVSWSFSCLAISRRKLRVNLVQGVTGDAQRGKNFPASGFAAPLFDDMAPGEQTTHQGRHQKTRCQPLPDNDPATNQFLVPLVALIEDALPQSGGCRPAQESLLERFFEFFHLRHRQDPPSARPGRR